MAERGALATGASSLVDGPGEESQRECTVHEGLRTLVQLLPRVMRGMRRRPSEPIELEGVALGSRHGSLLALLRENRSTVGALATALGLNLATVSGLVADLERVGFVERSADPADRRRTIVRVRPGHEAAVDAWLEGATAPIVRALRQLSPQERAVFVKAMGYLDAELNISSVRLADRSSCASSCGPSNRADGLGGPRTDPVEILAPGAPFEARETA